MIKSVIISYILISGTVSHVMDRAHELIKDGYEPHGSISCASPIPMSLMCTQPMVVKIDKEVKE